MNGWVEAKLGDLFSFKNGMNAEKSAYGNGIPFVNVMDVFGTDVLTSDIVRGKIQASENQIKEYLVKRGDVLFNRTSETFDEIALATVYMDDAPIVFGGFVIRARPRTSKLDPNFCVYFFQADAMRREMIRRGQGAVRANIGQKDLATVPAAVPPLAEQKRIAEILSTWDRAIETTEKLIANSEAQKKALRQQLLTGKKRLPGFSGEWRTTKIGKLCNVTTGQPAPNENSAFGESGLPFVRVSSLSKLKNTSVSEFELVSERAAKKWGLQKFEPGTLIFAKSGMSAKLGKIELLDRSVYLVSHLAALIAKNTNDIRFIKYWFEMNSPGQLVQGDGFPSIRTSEIKLLSIRIPDTQEQKAVADAIAVADRAERNLVEMKSRLASEKFALMQQLLTGKRRVKVKREAHAA